MISREVISEADRQDIHRQLERLLAHPLFRLSKRLPAFLQYAINEFITHGDSVSPKERTIGIEVFGRKADYDTNADPIVRVTATELRKKLAQYYYSDGRHDEILIELPLGSYLPKIRRVLPAEIESEVTMEIDAHSPRTVKASKPPEGNGHHSPVEPASPATTLSPEESTREEAPSTATVTDSVVPGLDEKAPWKKIAVALTVVLLLSWLGIFLSWQGRRNSSTLRFWGSFPGSDQTVAVVMPVISNLDQTRSARPSAVSVAPNLSIEDTTIAARVAAQLEKAEVKYWLLSSETTGFDQLRTSPAVLIGALDNIWTLRLTKDLPFIFEQTEDDRTGRITERRDGKVVRSWSVDISTPHQRITQDYGVVARYRSPLTGQSVVVIAGISSQGTQAAGEMLTTPEYLRTALEHVGQAKNFELVIQTEAIDGRAGPPHVVAYRTW